MSKPLIAPLLIMGAALMAAPAWAELGLTSDIPGKIMNARIGEEMRSRASRLGTSDSGYNPTDTTWVGYNPAYAGSNYWSIGVGDRRPKGVTGPDKADVLPVKDEDMGYWDWDNPVHGDTLQGWWPMRHCYATFFIHKSKEKMFRTDIVVARLFSFLVCKAEDTSRSLCKTLHTCHSFLLNL